MRRRGIFKVLCILCCISAAALLSADETKSGLRLLPPVIENVGQFHEEIRYVISGPDGCIAFFEYSIIAVRAIEATKHGESAPPGFPLQRYHLLGPRTGIELSPEYEVTEITFTSRNPDAVVQGMYEQKARASYKMGGDPSEWVRDIPLLKGVGYFRLWPGVTLLIRQEDDGEIKCTFQGMLRGDSDNVPIKVTRHKPNEMEQTSQVERTLSADLETAADELGQILSSAVGSGWRLEHSHRAIYDLRGAFLAEAMYCPTDAGDSLACFVAHLDDSGEPAWISILGGDSHNVPHAVARDWEGRLVLNGFTRSRTFPTTQDAYKREYSGSQNYFHSKFSQSGDLLYSSYLGAGGGGLDTSPAMTPDERSKSPRLLAIIVDDVRTEDQIEDFLALDIPVTFAVMPWVTDSCLKRILSEGSTAFLHAPMEALGSLWPRGPEIRVSHAEEEVRELLEGWLEQTPGVTGINNHRGSRATSDPETMKIVLSVVKERGLVFVDSHTSHTSIAVNVARDKGIPSLQQDIFLDDPSELEVTNRLMMMAEIAERRGYSAGICHVGRGPSVPAALRSVIPQLQSKGFRFVSIPELLETIGK